MDESFVPNLDPVQSDFLTQEYSEAVYKILDGLIHRLEKDSQ